MFGGSDRKQLARAMGLSQVGMLMVVPAVIGLLLDYYLHWAPWGVIVGAVLGLVTGIAQLVRLSAPEKKTDSTPDQKIK